MPLAADLALKDEAQTRSANPAVQFFRAVFQQRVAAIFPAGARVLDLAGPLDGLRAERPWDGAHAAPGSLDGADLGALGAALAGCLRAEAPVVLCLPGPLPLPALLQRALRARGAWRRGQPAVAAARALGREFVWTGSFGIGLLVPGAAQRDWIVEHPQTFGVLAALERPVRRWPLVRDLGEQLVLEGRRR
jgi:hypothetical protein